MLQYTIVVEGMACSMCEAHVNDAIRKAFPVKKVTSSHSIKLFFSFVADIIKYHFLSSVSKFNKFFKLFKSLAAVYHFSCSLYALFDAVAFAADIKCTA